MGDFSNPASHCNFLCNRIGLYYSGYKEKTMTKTHSKLTTGTTKKGITNILPGAIPAASRAGRHNPFLKAEAITPELVGKLNALNDIAKRRGQSLSQMAIAWLLRDERITSVLTGASRPQQITDNLKALSNLAFSDDELRRIEEIL
jgi:aryl-alcohol dehydrogenase-like predicted oxidoreductase